MEKIMTPAANEELSNISTQLIEKEIKNKEVPGPATGDTLLDTCQEHVKTGNSVPATFGSSFPVII